jgi:hypothetical protein
MHQKEASMPIVLSALISALTYLFLAAATVAAAQALQPLGVDSRFADVNGTRLHYLVAGQGAPVMLLHGYTQTSHMWRPLIAELAKTHTVLAPDLRGAGQSAKPPQGYDKKTLAQDIHALASSRDTRHWQLPPGCRPWPPRPCLHHDPVSEVQQRSRDVPSDAAGTSFDLHAVAAIGHHD